MSTSTTSRLSRYGWAALLVLASLQARPAPAQSEQVAALLERVTVQAIARGPDGAMYLAGFTSEPDLPGTAGALQPTLTDPSCADDLIRVNSGACKDAFLAKLDPTGREILFATYLGGGHFEEAYDLVVDEQGHIYLLGTSRSQDFPVTETAVQQTFAGDGSAKPAEDLFIAKINADADQLLYSTYLGGAMREWAGSIEIAGDGDIYVRSYTLSPDFPVTEGAYLTALQFPETPPVVDFSFELRASTVTRINPSSQELVYSTFFDRQVTDMVVDGRGAVLLVGPAAFVTVGIVASFPNSPPKGAVSSREAFLATLSPDGTTVESHFSFGDFDWDGVADVELDIGGNAWLTGSKTFSGSPFGFYLAGVRDPGGFLARLTPDGEILFSNDLPATGRRLTLGEDNQATVIGTTSRANIPTTSDAYFSGPCADGFAMSFDDGGSPLYGSYVPFSIRSVFASYVSPGEVEFLWEDLDELKSVRTTDEPPSFACVTHGATGGRISPFAVQNPFAHILLGLPSSGLAAVSPGQIVDLHGSGWGPEETVPLELDGNGHVTTSLAGVRVLFDGVPAPLLSVQDRVIRAIAPFSFSPDIQMAVEVESAEGRTPPLHATKFPASPGIFTLDGTGDGQAAVLNEDGTLNSPDNPARKGSVIAIFATGGGALIPTPIDGSITPIDGAYPRLALPVEVFMGDTVDILGTSKGQTEQGVEVLYAGAAPGLIAGVIQVNARVPEDAVTGPNVGLHLRVGSASFNPNSFVSPVALPIPRPTIAIE